jgi:hypothetical protein
LRLKHIASLLAALLLLASLAMPAFAAPEDGAATTGTEESAGGKILTEDEIQAMISAAVADLQPETTMGIVPLNEGNLLLAQEEDEGLLSQRNMTFAALGLGGFAVLLSILALARTRQKAAPNATGNYQKYF